MHALGRVEWSADNGLLARSTVLKFGKLGLLWQYRAFGFEGAPGVVAHHFIKEITYVCADLRLYRF